MQSAMYLLTSLGVSTLAAPSPSNYQAWNPSRRDLKLDFHNFQADSYPYQIQISCGDTRRQDIINGIAEAGYLANQLFQTTPSSSYKSNLDKYFGDKASDNYDNYLKTPVQNVNDLHNGRIDVNAHNIYMVCNPAEENLPECPFKVGARTYKLGKDAMVVVCGRYHAQPSLGDLIKEQRGGATKTATDLWASRGSIMLHETYHITPWIGADRTSDYEDQNDKNGKLIYGPAAVADLAKRRNVYQTALINDAYVSTAVSSYWQSMFTLKDVLEATDISTADADTDSGPEATIQDDYQVNQKSYRTWTAQAADFNALDYFPSDYPGNDCKSGDTNCNYISGCGSHWMPLDDFGGFQGYKSAVDQFCRLANMDHVPPGSDGSKTLQVALSGGNDPSKGVTEGSLKFEIRNKSDQDHFCDLKNCVNNLMKMATAGSNCYGSGYGDTKGGTWQVGKDAISYHAFPSKDKKHDELVAGFEVQPSDGAEPNGSEGGTILDVGE